VRGAAPVANADLARQRKVVEAYIAASRNGDFDALLAVLDPDIVLRVDYGEQPLGVPKLVRGARNVAHHAQLFARPGPEARLALINGTVGAVVSLNGKVSAIAAFTIAGDKIVELNILADPERVDQLAIAMDA
jgi:RNA polymerase sigma-70 factor (ECF subfamily)